MRLIICLNVLIVVIMMWFFCELNWAVGRLDGYDEYFVWPKEASYAGNVVELKNLHRKMLGNNNYLTKFN